MSRAPLVDPNVTQPSARTTSVRATPSGVAISWVFPAVKVSQLTAGHCFGRDVSCDTVLSGAEVSRQHARVDAASGWQLLRDLSSRNGLFVGGQRVEEHRLGPGDVVRIGEWVGIVHEADGGALEPSPLIEIAPGWYGGPRLAASAATLRQVAPSDLPIVIEGETGSGKEGAARAAHSWSRRTGPFVAVDCGALPENIADALLFGHAKGAFTSADRARPGYFRAADSGTLFLDEVLNLDASVQSKLLRVLERREVVPVGESRPVAVDVRVICAAQVPLATAAAAGRFRNDLMARLEGVTQALPPLRERREDIVPLFYKLLAQHGGAAIRCEPRFIESLLLYDWPLNVRELVLLARRMVALQPSELLKRSMLPERMLELRRPKLGQRSQVEPSRPSNPAPDDKAIAELVEALRVHAGNLTKAAAMVGLSRGRAYRLLEAQPDFELDSLRKR